MIELYLKYNPKFLDDYVKVNVERLQIARWLDLKSEESDIVNAAAGTNSQLSNL